ncbi:MAG: tetratricopeptide repeat protein [Nitrosospira sp.]
MSNMSDDYIPLAPETESDQPIHDAIKQNRDPTSSLNAANTLDAPLSNNAKPPTVPPTEKRPDDHHFAVRLYQENAEKGNSDAQYKLGLLYLTGNGALQDFTEAAKWLKLAAEQGHASAQYELGLIYRTGYGLATDQVQSYMWLNLAAAAGIQQAVMARDEVMRSLSSKQLAQAQKNSREWLASRPKPRTPGEAAKAVDIQPDTAGGTESSAAP